MSKFISLISTFKNGLITPRLRGSIKQPDDLSSAEQLDNFIVDRVGAACKRVGLHTKYSLDAGGIKFFYTFDLLGTKYNFHFDSSNTFNSTYYLNATYPYASSFCKVFTQDGSFNAVKVYGKDYVNSATDVGSLALFTGRHATNSGGTFIDSGINDYLNRNVYIRQAQKISDRTIVFTTVDDFSFLISLMDYVPAGSTTAVRQFIMYPYFVSAILLQQMLGKNVSSAAKCPIVPSNFPFNSINTDTSLTVTTSEVVLNVSGTNYVQSGSAPSAGIVLKSNERQVYFVTVPLAMVYVNGIKIGLQGRFIILPSSDALKDVVFFLNKEQSVDSTTVTYLATLVVGGVPPASTSQWKLSTWGRDNHPRVVNMCFGRLVYGNAKYSPSQWWASAVHPNAGTYFQGFKGDYLLQDATSDASGINYQGSSGTGTTDIYRYGFTNLVPNYGEICWISHRRRVHFGTTLGECQATTSDGIFSSSSYSQIQTGTDKSSLIQQAEGNRKIFYIANDGKDIRSISTEDKDYESVDKLLTIPLQGFKDKFTKLVWSEKFSCLMALTDASELYIITIHGDTEIRAISKFKSGLGIVDISEDSIIVSYEDSLLGPLEAVTKLETSFNGGISPIHADLYTYYTDSGDVPLPPTPSSDPVFMAFKGKVYTITDPSTITTLSDLPFADYSDISAVNPLYVFKYKITARLKTVAIHQGANFGSSVGCLQRVDKATILIDNSGPFKYGSDLSNMLDSENVASGDTGIINVDFPASPDVEQHVYIESEDISPLNISGISIRGVSYSGE